VTPEATVTVRLFAGARAAAGGTAELVLPASSLPALRTALVERFGEPMARVLPLCAYLVDGVSVPRADERGLDGVTTVDVLPPFAGG
jgi:molybdopterin converting factor small subunit